MAPESHKTKRTEPGNKARTRILEIFLHLQQLIITEPQSLQLPLYYLHTTTYTMVLFMLYLKAELDGVASIKHIKDAPLCITVCNPLSDYEVREKVVVDRTETVEQAEGAREPPHHFQLKWDGSKKQSTLAIVDEAAIKTALKKKKNVQVPRDYTADDSGEWVPMVAVECKGLEPTAFFAMGKDFVVTSTGGVEFSDDVDISEGDWGDYDEEHDAAVSLTDVEFKWESI